MNTETLLQWHYLIFLLPFGMAAFLLLLSSLHLGHHGGHGGHHGHAFGHGHAGHAPAGAGHGHGAPGGHAPSHAHAGSHPHTHSHGQAHGNQGGNGKAAAKGGRAGLHSATGLLSQITGVGRAPLPMILESFCIGWGFSGFWANRWLLPMPNPTLVQMLPSLGIALAGGLAVARLAAEVIARLLPPEETLVVSRDGLFGLTGSITFPATETGGRIHIYDEYGTLHDEMCRVAPNHPPIEKGQNAIVMDMDAQGHLVVEEVPNSVR